MIEKESVKASGRKENERGLRDQDMHEGKERKDHQRQKEQTVRTLRSPRPDPTKTLPGCVTELLLSGRSSRGTPPPLVARNAAAAPSGLPRLPSPP